MKFRLLGLAAASVLAFSAQASDYQTEVGLGYLTTDGFDAFVLNGEYHFNMVDTSNIALSEAAFYERSNNVFAVIGTGDLDAQTIGLEYYFNNFYVAPSYTNFDNDGLFAIDLGYSPMKGLLFTTTVPEDDYDLNVNAKYVAPLAGGRAYNLEAGYIDTDFDSSFTIGGDYYFNKNSGVGVTFGDDVIELRGEHFFTPKFKAGLSYTDVDVPGADGIVGIDVAWRF